MQFRASATRCVGTLLVVALGTAPAIAQTRQTATPQSQTTSPQAQQTTPSQQGTPTPATPALGNGVTQAKLSEYVLGPNDEITVLAVDIEEISNKPIRISTNGDINLPMAGKIHVAGMTVRDVEDELVKRLKKYYVAPDVAVLVTALKSQPVTIVGAVRNPGPYQLEGRKNLLEALVLAGGRAPEASSAVTITRQKENGRIPLPSATTGEESVSTVRVNVKAIEDGRNPEQNIQILPYDTIAVAKAPVVIAAGQFTMPGRYALADKENISLKVLVSWAGGWSSTAASKNARLIRQTGTNTTELEVNLQDIMKGKATDLVLNGDDILWVPESRGKRILQQTSERLMNTATSLPFYMIP